MIQTYVMISKQVKHFLIDLNKGIVVVDVKSTKVEMLIPGVSTQTRPDIHKLIGLTIMNGYHYWTSFLYGTTFYMSFLTTSIAVKHHDMLTDKSVRTWRCIAVLQNVSLM